MKLLHSGGIFPQCKRCLALKPIEQFNRIFHPAARISLCERAQKTLPVIQPPDLLLELAGGLQPVKQALKLVKGFRRRYRLEANLRRQEKPADECSPQVGPGFRPWRFS